MEFEYAGSKSKTNKEKYKMDFVEARKLREAPDMIEIPVNTSDEPGYLVIGQISGKHRAGIITFTGTEACECRFPAVDYTAAG